MIRAVTDSGDIAPTERLYQWLGIGLDKYGTPRVGTETARAMGEWLSARPELQRRLFELHVELARKRASEKSDLHLSRDRTYLASQPQDWYGWLLKMGAQSTDERVVRYCLDQATYVAMNRPDQFDITLEDIEKWVDENRKVWPEVERWKIAHTAWGFDSWQRREFDYKREQEARCSDERIQRHSDIVPLLPALMKGKGELVLLRQVAMVYQSEYHDTPGATPLARVAELLVVDEKDVRDAVEGLKVIVSNGRLPSLEEILDLWTSKGKVFTIGFPALLAAKLLHEGGQSSSAWPNEVRRSLIAFYMVDGGGNLPDWCRALAKDDPVAVSDLMLFCWKAGVASGRPPLLDALHFLRGSMRQVQPLSKYWSRFSRRCRVSQMNAFTTFSILYCHGPLSDILVMTGLPKSFAQY